MIYKDHEIYARVGGTYSDLYSLNQDGTLDESQDILIINDKEIIWFEVEVVDPKTGQVDSGAQFDNLVDARKAIDESVAFTDKEIAND